MKRHMICVLSRRSCDLFREVEKSSVELETTRRRIQPWVLCMQSLGKRKCGSSWVQNTESLEQRKEVQGPQGWAEKTNKIL